MVSIITPVVMVNIWSVVKGLHCRSPSQRSNHFNIYRFVPVGTWIILSSTVCVCVTTVSAVYKSGRCQSFFSFFPSWCGFFFSFQEEQFSSVNAEVSQLHLRVHKAAELRPPRLSLRLISRGKRSSEPESNVRSMRAGWRVQLSGIRDCVKLNNNTNQTHFKSSKMTRQHGRHLDCSPSSWHTPPHPTKSSQMWR